MSFFESGRPSQYMAPDKGATASTDSMTISPKEKEVSQRLQERMEKAGLSGWEMRLVTVSSSIVTRSELRWVYERIGRRIDHDIIPSKVVAAQTAWMLQDTQQIPTIEMGRMNEYTEDALSEVIARFRKETGNIKLVYDPQRHKTIFVERKSPLNTDVPLELPLDSRFGLIPAQIKYHIGPKLDARFGLPLGTFELPSMGEQFVTTTMFSSRSTTSGREVAEWTREDFLFHANGTTLGAGVYGGRDQGGNWQVTIDDGRVNHRDVGFRLQVNLSKLAARR